MKNSPPPYYPAGIQLTTAVSVITFVTLVIYSFSNGWFMKPWILPIVISIAVLGIKFTYPRIPFLQAIGCIVIICINNLISGYLLINVSPFFYFLENIIFDGITVFGFGLYWVRCNYVPAGANY